VSYDMAKGNAVNAVLLEAEEYNPGIIIMGTRGSELEGLRSFGSFTSQIIDKSPIPILAIPSGYDSQNIDSLSEYYMHLILIIRIFLP